ncbi:ribonuclease Z [Peijinzhouia sedimentorum]
MEFQLQILGSNSAAPAHNRNQTSQLLRIGNEWMLIDCGEGTQIQLRNFKIPFQKISRIFISHLHGDHYLGLVGLLFTFHLLQRKSPLTIYGPPGLREIISLQLKYSNSSLQYDLDFIEWKPEIKELLFENEHFTVNSFPLKHRIPCSGFVFLEKPKPKSIIKENLPDWIRIHQFQLLKNGEDISHPETGEIFTNWLFTKSAKKSRKYVFCSDTIYDESIISTVAGADLLYHEATFMDDMTERASQTFHSTAKQAASIALKANVKMLLLGHFSIRYKDLEPLQTEAREVFAESYLAIEGEKFSIPE